ncbi:altered inheritance of mitochondria protein 44 [Drosophila elegans]|uniref:altered inheritance of mitochondria protein 44 n=1 Tax=Drosophila elegans TaxID=30023 RepID=UPI0007E795DC|nr:altered inheritance of mitochondria protein 44 [Drosophila elegans]
MSNRKSKLLKSLEDSVPPIDHEDVVRLIADQIRQPLMDPIERNRNNKEDLSILHLEDAIKFRDSMSTFHISPTAESLDEVMPVKDEDLGEMIEILTDSILVEEDEGENEDEEDNYDDEDEDEEDDENDEDVDEVEDLGDGEENVKTGDSQKIDHKNHIFD